jgi:hypothetical protein
MSSETSMYVVCTREKRSIGIFRQVTKWILDNKFYEIEYKALDSSTLVDIAASKTALSQPLERSSSINY